MSSILLQLESALADARAALERAAEKLHDTGVKNALAKSEYDAAAEAVKRVEGALNSMHGVSSPAPAASSSDKVISAAEPPAPAKKRRAPEGPACPSCGEIGKLSLQMRGTMRFAICGGCNAEIAQ